MKDILNKARRDPTNRASSFDMMMTMQSRSISSSGCVAPFQTALDWSRHRSVAVDFNMGYAAEFGANGISAAEIHRPYFVAGLAAYVRGGTKLTIMNFAHEKILRFMPTITLSDARCSCGLHSSNDPAKARETHPRDAAHDRAGRRVRGTLAISEADVRQVFSAT